jgi:hypothetical protein
MPNRLFGFCYFSENSITMRIFAALTLFFSTIHTGLFCQHAIPFQLLESGHILVKAKVDGVEGKFIFDTGAGITVFTKTFFEKLPYKKQQDGGYTAFRATGERLDIDLFQVRNVEFGTYKQTVQEVSYFDFNLGGIDGIISLKMLEQQPFTIDFKKKAIKLETTQTVAALKKTGNIIPLQTEQSRGKSLDIFAYFKLNDTLTLQLCLDSGAGSDVFKFNSKYLTRLGINTSDTATVKKYEKRSEMDAAFVSTTYAVKLQKLAAASSPAINVTGFKAQFVDGLIYDGIMFINWLGSQITIDLPKQQMIVQK